MGHHRFIKVTMAVWLVDPLTEPPANPATSGPPDDEVAADLAGKIKLLKAKGGRGGKKDHSVRKAEVTATESTTIPPD